MAAGLHGANRLGGNSLSDLLVFGKRAGEYAAAGVRVNAVSPGTINTPLVAGVLALRRESGGCLLRVTNMYIRSNFGSSPVWAGWLRRRVRMTRR